MTISQLIPKPLRSPARKLLKNTLRLIHPPANVVVKSNTKSAFNYFWKQDQFIENSYLSDDRIDFYHLVADYCADILNDITSPSPTKIMDFGCGSGHFLKVLEEHAPDSCELEIHGADFAPSAIKIAKQLLPDSKFTVEDIFNTDIQSNSFDMTLCLETLEHLDNPEKALKQLLRITRPGGQLIISVPNGEIDTFEGHVNFWSINQFRQLLTPHGLENIQLVNSDTSILAHVITPTKEGAL